VGHGADAADALRYLLRIAWVASAKDYLKSTKKGASATRFHNLAVLNHRINTKMSLYPRYGVYCHTRHR